MEGSPDEETQAAAGRGQPPPPRAKPNLWLLVGITLLSLLTAAAVILLTVVSP